MNICVESEIGKLKKVLLHRPGKELEHLVPDSLTRLLFDDIPYLDIAQQEHDYFAEILEENGAEVLYLEDLVSEVLSKEDIKTKFIKEFIESSTDIASNYKQELFEYLSNIQKPYDLVIKTMTGVHVKELKLKKSNIFSKYIDNNYGFILDPIPNLYFTRDTFSNIGKHVSLNRMYSQTRRRESIYGKYIFEYHKDYKHTKRCYTSDLPYTIEGGDILNISNDTICVGISQRTQAEAVEALARNLILSKDSAIQKVLAIEIPSTRAFMHLDTVFTQLDYDKFTIHPQIFSSLRCFELTANDENNLSIRLIKEPLEVILADCLKVDRVKLIYCGGMDNIASQREQWNDASNTLCIEPGKVIVYDRNKITNKLLQSQGVETICIRSSELSRGRGGPRCMSMPLLREAI